MYYAKPDLFAKMTNAARARVPEKVELISKLSSGISLDAGCGRGQYFRYFNCQQLVAIDISTIMLRKALKTRHLISIVLADVRKLPYRNRIFDFVWSSEVIEHLTEEDGRNLLLEFKRVGKGKIVITTPNYNIFSRIVKTAIYPKRLKSDLKHFHFSFYTPFKLKKLGFKVIKKK